MVRYLGDLHGRSHELIPLARTTEGVCFLEGLLRTRLARLEESERVDCVVDSGRRYEGARDDTTSNCTDRSQ